MAGHVMTCFRAQCRICESHDLLVRIMSDVRRTAFIMSEIMAKVYPVKWYIDVPRRALLDQLESALHNWMIELPDELRYHETGNRPAPPPHVLILHAEYYSALLLLYRALYVQLFVE